MKPTYREMSRRRRTEPARIAVRCSNPRPETMRKLSRWTEPVDLWLHPADRRWKRILETDPRVRRVCFSPVRDAGEQRPDRSSRLPVYGPYEDVIDLDG